MYEILFFKEAQKFFNKLDNSSQKQIAKKIEQLKINPKEGKPLTGNLAGFWRVRADKYRILYRIQNDKLLVLIIDIGHRKNIYD